MTADSLSYVKELSKVIYEYGGQPTSETTTASKIYRTWMDFKMILTGKHSAYILSYCEFGEYAAQKAYAAVLKSDSQINGAIRQLIIEQKAKLKDAYDTIKKYRNLEIKTA